MDSEIDTFIATRTPTKKIENSKYLHKMKFLSHLSSGRMKDFVNKNCGELAMVINRYILRNEDNLHCTTDMGGLQCVRINYTPLFIDAVLS